MKRLYTYLLAIICCLGWAGDARASHAQGADLTYAFVSYNAATGAMRYVVTATFYRDCSGIAAPDPMPLTISNTACAGGTYSTTVNLPLINGLPCPYGGVSGPNGCEVSQLCPSSLPLSTCNGGSTYPGVQKYVYRDTITLPGTSTANNFCSQWYLSIDISARNPSANITPGDLYIEALINNSINPATGTPYTNSSAVFGYDPVPFVCQTYPVSYNNGASDPNGDSLVFQLITPLQGHNSPLAFNSGYSVDTPIKVLNHQFTFNSSSGQINFDPAQQEVDVLALKVSEYRNGVLVGTTIRDVQVKILTCTVPVATQEPLSNLNNANQLDSTTLQLCPGTTASWDIKMTDANGDSIVVKSNITSTPSPLPGATVTQVDSSRSVVSAHITWTPQVSDTGCHYYQITTNTIDCPVEGNYTKSYRVCVYNKVTVSPHEAIYCGSAIQLNATGGTNSHWTPTTGLTFPTGLFNPLAAPAVTTKYTFTSDCGTDTSLIIYNPPFTMSAGTGGTICQNSSIQLNASVDNLYSPYTIVWIPATGLTNPVTHGSGDSILNPIASPPVTTQYTVEFIANTGCVRTDSVKVIVSGYSPALQAKANPTMVCPGQPSQLTVTANPECGTSTHACTGNSTTIQVGTGTANQGGSGSVYPSPYGNYYKSARHQFLFHANELYSQLGSGGQITSVALDIGVLNSGSTLTNFTIRMGCVDPSIDSLTGYVSEALLTTVYVYNYTPVFGFNNHNLQIPYNWDGHSNLVIDICFQNTTSNNINNKMKYTVTPFRSVWCTYANDAAGQCGYTGRQQNIAPLYATYFQRPDFKFNICTIDLSNANLQWTPSSGPNAPFPTNKDTVIAHPVNQTTYHVTLTDTSGCTSTDFVTVYVDTSNKFTVSPDTFICSVSPVQLHATATGTNNPNLLTYTWSASTGTAPPSGVGLTYANPTVTPTASTLYTCVVSGGSGCLLGDTARITIGNSIPINKIVDSISCSGGNNGKVIINMNAGTPPYTYTWNHASSTVDSITNLSAGTYYLTVVDNIGCSGKDTTTLVNPSPLSLILDSVNVLCYGNTTGTVTALASGGRGPYRYTWSPTEPNTKSLTNLAAGLYKVTVTDTSGCTITGQVNITQPAQLVSSAHSTNLTGATTHDGTVKVNTTGGTAPYTYTWTPAVAGNVDTIGGLNAGTYYIQVCDANGCCVKDTAVITVPPPINVVFTIVNNKCFDSCTGTASAVATGGVRPYTYKWNTNPVSISDTIINLCAGSYTLTVTDSNGISVANTITITAPTPITMIVDSTPITCNGANNGTLKDSAVAGGTSPYTITWSASTSGTNPITGLSPGTYYVTVTDANNCIATDSASLGQPTPVTATITATDSVKCFGQNNGIAMVLAGGGRPPYAYQWSGSASVTDSATDLIAGPQTVTVTDASGCTATASFSIDQPLQIIVTITTTPAHCATSNDGTATAIVSNGTPPYTYTWDAAAPGTNSTISSLASGPHTLTVTDVNGCFTQQTFTIDTLYVLHISLVADSVTCYGGHNGDATVTVANGNPNFTYVWSPSGDATNPATGLSAGVQTVTVTDSYRCTAIDSIPVYQPAQIVVSHSFINPLCYGDRNGKIWLSAAGGSGSYTYTYLGTSHPMTDTLTGLPSGTYIITVTDTKGCTQNDTVTLADPAKLQMYASQTAITCANAANGIIHVGATGGTPAYTFSWSTGGNSDTVRNNLPPGVYVITVTDANGCTSDTTETLIAPPPIIVIALTADSTSCPDSADGHISITVTGGTPGTAVLYQYSLNNGTWQTSSDFYDLAAGSYQVHARDSQLCQLDTSISVGQPLPVTVGINPLDTSIIVGSSMQLTTLLGGFTTQTINSYSWSPATGLSCIDCANPVATPYQTTQYQLVLNYGKNCTSKANASIEIEHGPDTYIPNAFTPNGDDVNDEFSVFGTKIKSVSMRIFNRWGEKVFDSDDSQWAVWDGTYKGVGQPAGVYVYVAQIVYLDDVKKTREGSVTLIR